MAVEVIALERASAARVASILGELFEKAGGIDGAGCRCRFTSEPRSNRLVVRAPAAETRAAQKIARGLDAGDESLSVEKLRNLDALEARDLLNSLAGN
ncbi:MAG: hypothetical protein M5R36_02410 [Deltaproteobacteria bacterium]|nr:hypothetical protein [Deltaproteobacteria bacterium]